MFCTSVGLLLAYCETACCWLHADGCDAVLHPIFYPVLLNADGLMVYPALIF